ncbi:MAG TPA: RsmE family RNA methyltransferase [Oligoflexia bacterium]|nr:RsmE family RNA methyltransferase [Oligoflexia bacterium]HMP48832.1 RsmE family RNA methyltransferase [Oligoflexia bacterium]
MPNLYLTYYKNQNNLNSQGRSALGDIIHVPKEEILGHYPHDKGSKIRVGIWPETIHPEEGCQPGETFDAEVYSTNESYGGISVLLNKRIEIAAVQPLDIVLGLSRPQILKRILELLQGFLVRNIFLVCADRSEKSFLNSKILNLVSIEKHLKEGSRQAGISYCPGVIIVDKFYNFPQYFKMFPFNMGLIADHEARDNLPNLLRKKMKDKDLNPTLSRDSSFKGPFLGKSVLLSIGPERGWTRSEKEAFKNWGFLPFSISSGILRVDVALSAATAQIRALF